MERQIGLINLIWSIFGLIFCFVVSAVVILVYDDYKAGIWTIFAGILSGLCFQLHFLRYFTILEKYYNSVKLQIIDFIGMSTCLIGFGSECWYLTYLVTWKNTGPVGNNDQLNHLITSTVCCLIFMVFGLYVKISAMVYVNVFKKERLSIIDEEFTHDATEKALID